MAITDSFITRRLRRLAANAFIGVAFSLLAILLDGREKNALAVEDATHASKVLAPSELESVRAECKKLFSRASDELRRGDYSAATRSYEKLLGASEVAGDEEIPKRVEVRWYIKDLSRISQLSDEQKKHVHRAVDRQEQLIRERKEREFLDGLEVMLSGINVLERAGLEGTSYLSRAREGSAAFWMQLGDYSTAVSVLEKVAALEKKELGDSHYKFNKTCTKLVRVLYDAGDKERAEEVLRRAMVTLPPRSAQLDEDYQLAMLLFCRINLDAKRLAETQVLLWHCRDGVKSEGAPPEVRATGVLLSGDFMVLYSDQIEARQHYSSAIEYLDKSDATRTLLMATLKERLADLEMRSGNTEEAVKLGTEAKVIRHYVADLLKRAKALHDEQKKRTENRTIPQVKSPKQ